MKLPNSKGTYILIFRLEKAKEVTLKNKKSFFLREGIYAYVGSAFGSGGLKARIERHVRKRKRKHWHLDYVSSLKEFKPLTVLCFNDLRIECDISRKFSEKFNIVEGFGASDCKCKSHLFYIHSFDLVDKIEFNNRFQTFYFGGCDDI